MAKGVKYSRRREQDIIELYHHMIVLLQETNEAAFQVLLQQFLSHLLEKYPQFYTPTLQIHICHVQRSGNFAFEKVP